MPQFPSRAFVPLDNQYGKSALKAWDFMYLYCNCSLPHFRSWLILILGLDLILEMHCGILVM